MSEEWKGMNPMENGSGEYAEENKNSSQEGQQETGFVLRDSTEETRDSQESGQEREPGNAPTPENPVYAHSYKNDEKKEGYNSYHFTTPSPAPEPKQQQERETKRTKPSSGNRSSMGKKAAALAAGAVAFGVIAGAVFLGVSYAGRSLLPQETTKIESTQVAADSSDVQSTGAGSSSEYTVSQVAKNAMPSIVSITGISIQEIPNYFGFGTQQYQGESSGSGIIVGQNDTELLIATNAHVVADTDSITVCFTNQDGTAATSSSDSVEQTSADGSSSLQDGTYVEAQIKGSDTDNDLAVVSVKIADIPEDILSQIKVATIGDSDALSMGDQVVAIGNALGYGQSVTSGYVSGLNKQVSSENANGTFIQTDAAINPGNSGGALLNMKGELVGINSAKIASSEVEGMGFAIPISQAEPILDQMMSQETREKVDESQASYLGVTCMDSTTTVNEMYNIPVGVFIYDVEENGPADQAGIKKGDVITKIDGTSVQTKEDLTGRLEYYKAGETVDIVLYRTDNGEYKEQTVSVTLGAKKDSPTMSSQNGQE
ncbi:MAG TPA: trypsin-like peptidase domain-containing protein [Candidatus Blautia merdavium]|uniref:Trypsin-like peptidase domain-containing protein n=1 Tax=Candidatus Blautia merdavium TaxID=2838494 RepID=A0A9D2PQX5_9FIRM|nr:trypsin-like peptidase domain-containing protein [Candidatus Blautia merdavium]